jgi:hypothetical protein
MLHCIAVTIGRPVELRVTQLNADTSSNAQHNTAQLLGARPRSLHTAHSLAASRHTHLQPSVLEPQVLLQLPLPYTSHKRHADTHSDSQHNIDNRTNTRQLMDTQAQSMHNVHDEPPLRWTTAAPCAGPAAAA